MFVNICYVRQAFDRKWQLFVVFFFTSGMFHYPSFRYDVVVEAKIENVVRKKYVLVPSAATRYKSQGNGVGHEFS